MPRLLLLLLLLALSACGEPAPLSGEEGAPDLAAPPDLAPAPYPPYSPDRPAICGQPAYQWLPTAQVGAVLEQSNGLFKTALELQALAVAARVSGQLNVRRSPAWNVQLAVLRYQTQDRGRPVDATAMVAYPVPLFSGKQTFPTTLLLHPTLGYFDDCAPSRGARSSLEPMTLFALLSASFGYVAVLPDYLNMKSLGAPSNTITPYLLMEPTAIASLDAVRAARAYLKGKGTDAQASAELYVWGHSQGGQAAAYTLALQPHYAPELSPRAAAVLAAPMDLVGSSRANFAGPEPLLILGQAVIYAWSSYYGGAALSSALLPPWDQTARAQLMGYCDPNYMDPLRKVTDPTQVFTPGFQGALLRPGERYEPWSCWLRYNNPATLSLRMARDLPLLYVTGEKDVTVPAEGNLPVARRWCEEGQPLRYLSCRGADHAGVFPYALDEVYDFFEARQKGQALQDRCVFGAPVKCASTP